MHDLCNGSEAGQFAVLDSADVVGVAGGEIDVVQHHDDGAAQGAGGVVQVLHHLHGVGDVEVIEGLIKKYIVGFLAEHHGYVGPLPLAT